MSDELLNEEQVETVEPVESEEERLQREEQERIIREQEERERAEEEARERARLEHEALLNSFPDTTVFFDRIIETDMYKCLGSWTKSAYTADSLGFLDNHYDESELTFVPSNKELTSGVYYLKGHEKPESTIEELKVKKLAEISAEAHKYSQYECEDMYLTSSVGYKINADHKSQDNIRGLIGLGVQCRFKDYNNEYHPGTTIEQLQTMLTECYANGAMLYQQKFNYEDMVANAKSREELYFDVVFDMADFSKS